jgi:hypothetical protein
MQKEQIRCNYELHLNKIGLFWEGCWATPQPGFLFSLKKNFRGGHQWLTPIIIATQEAEIRRITIQGQPGQIVRQTLS